MTAGIFDAKFSQPVITCGITILDHIVLIVLMLLGQLIYSLIIKMIMYFESDR